MPRIAVSVAAAALLAACARELGPDDTYLALTRAVADRDADTAWSLLSRESQRRLDARAHDAAAQAPGVVPASGKQLLLGDAALAARRPLRVEVASASAESAVLRVVEEGRPAREVALVREGRAWRVQLP